jgi:uncharacterized membrane protein
MNMENKQALEFDRPALKATAKAQIKGKIGTLFLCGLVIALISGVTIPIVGAGLLIMPSFAISLVMIYLALTKGETPKVGDVFKGFSLFGKALWLSILTGFFTFLWSLLLFVPGLIKSISYSMASFILAENPNMTAREALSESKRITDSYKMKLFVLQLSFIGWALLMPLTLGLLGIWLVPYMSATMANAYLEIKQSAQS